MLIVAVSLLLIGGLAVTGRSISRLGDVPLRSAWLVVVALVGQTIVVSSSLIGSDGVAHAVHLGSYALLAAFLWLNRRLPWLWVVAVGGACNALVIAVNAGVMPAPASALRAAGMPATADHANSGLVAAPRLLALGDVFHTPRWLPLANVFSLGDALIVVGLALVVIAATRPPAVGVAAPHPTVRDRHAYCERGSSPARG